MVNLQLFSFIINEETVDDTPLYVFKLPNSVAKIYSEICQPGKRSAAYKTFFKVASSCFENIIHCNNTMRDIRKDGGIWFYATESFELDLLKAKVCEWLAKEYKKHFDEPLQEKFQEEWYFEEPVSLKEIVANNQPSIYRLVPGYYIYKLSKEEFKFESITRTLKFHRIVGEEKSGMMTEPVKLENKTYTPFAYAIDCNLTAPIDGAGLCLNFWLHVKRWEERALVKEDINFVSSKGKRTIYVYKENPYFYSDCILFNAVSIKREGGTIACAETADQLYTEILEVDIEEIAKVEGANKGKEDEKIFVTYKNIGKTLTQPGAGLPERNEMLKLLEEKLPQLSLRQPINFLSQPKNSKISLFKKLQEELKPLDIQPEYWGAGNKKINKFPYIANEHYKYFKLYIASREKSLYDKVVEICRYQLRLAQVGANEFASEDNIKIKIISVDNAFCTTLQEDGSDREERIEQVKACFEVAHHKELNMAIIDLPNYATKNKISDKQDPKNLIRNTCRSMGVLTQFIDYEEQQAKKDVVIEKVVNTVKDMLSAAGFMEAFIYEQSIISSQDALVGIGKISTGNNDNIIGMSKIVKGKILLNIYGVNKWMSIQEYIFKLKPKMLDNMSIKIPYGKGKQVQQEIDHWIRTELSKVLEDYERVYAFVDYSLRRNLWSVATNGKFLAVDQLMIPGKERLRMVRINGGEEIPEYYINYHGDILNKRSGIFKGERHTYYLVGRRSDTDQANQNWTKCDVPTVPLKRPALQEINVQCCDTQLSMEEKEYDRVAELTQILRSVNLSYENHTLLPLPLYCMGRLTEYIRAMSE